LKNYAFTGDRTALIDLGYILHRHNGLSYSRPDYYRSEAFYMVARNKMILQCGQIRYQHTFSVVDFIIKNKNKNEEFWIDNNTMKPIYALTNDGNIVTRDLLIDKLFNELIETLPEDIAKKFSISFYSRDICIPFSNELIKNVLELNDIKPLEIV